MTEIIHFSARSPGTFSTEPPIDETRNWVLKDLLARWAPSPIERLGALVDVDVREQVDRYDKVVEAVKQTDEVMKMIEPVQRWLDDIQRYEVTNEVALDPKRGRMGGLQGPGATDRSEAGGLSVSPAALLGLSLPGPGSPLHGY